MPNEFVIKNGFISQNNSNVSGLLTTTTFRLTSGATNGYVLTSDGSGNATWNPLSATTGYFDVFVTGGTYSNGSATFTNNTGGTFNVTGFYTGGSDFYTVTAITSSQTLTWDKSYWGVSGSSNVDLTLPTTTLKDGYYLLIKDEAGTSGSYRIRLTPTSGLIDGNSYVDMNINYMSLTVMVRNNNWYII